MKLTDWLKIVFAIPFLLTLPACGGRRTGKNLEPVWHVPIASTATPVCGDGAVFVPGFHAGHPDEPRTLFALEATTGKERWARVIPVKSVVHVSGTRLFWIDGDNALNMLDTRTGNGKPGMDTSSVPENFAIRERTILFVDVTGKLTSADTESGTVAWRTPTPSLGKPCLWGSVVAADDRVALVAGGCYPDPKSTANLSFLCGYDRASGAQLWRIDLKDRVSFGTTLLAGGTLFQGFNTLTEVRDANGGTTSFTVNTLRAYDPLTGKEKWTVEPGGEPRFLTDGVLYVDTFGKDAAGKDLDFKRGLDATTGNERWRTPHGIQRAGIGNLVPVGSLVWTTLAEKDFDLRREYTGDYQGSKVQAGFPQSLTIGSVLGVNAETGDIVRQSLPLKSTRISGIAVADGRAFAATISEMKDGMSGVWAFSLP